MVNDGLNEIDDVRKVSLNCRKGASNFAGSKTDIFPGLGLKSGHLIIVSPGTIVERSYCECGLFGCQMTFLNILALG